MRSGSCSFSLFCVLAFSLLFAACSAVREEDNQDSAALFSSPEVIPLKLASDGYTINPHSGDTILFEENTIQTGKIIPFTGKEPNPADISPPFSLLAGAARVVRAKTNVHPLTSPPSRVLVNRDSIIIKTIQTENTKEEAFEGAGSKHIKVSKKGSAGPISSGFHLIPISAPPPSYRDNFSHNITWIDVRKAIESPNVSKITQDFNGNFWFSSEVGLCLYDGVNFYRFTGDDYLFPKNASYLYLDKDSSVWMGATDGIYRFDGDSMYMYSRETGAQWDQGRIIFRDSKGVLWFGYEAGGISALDGDTYTHYHLDEGINDFGIRGIEEDSEGNIWIATWGRGLIRFDGNAFRYYRRSSGLIADYLMFLNLDRQGNLWFNSTGGLQKFCGDTLLTYTEEQGMNSQYVIHTAFDQQNNLWYTTNGGGVSMFDGTEFHDYTVDEGMTVDYVSCLCIDRDQNIWAGTSGGSVCVIKSNRLIHLDKDSGLGHDVVFSVAEDSQQNLWFGTRGGGASKYDGSSFTHYSRELLNLGNNYVLSIMQDRKGRMWFGTFGNGVTLMSGDSIYIANMHHGLSDYTVNCMHHDLQGEYWFGTYRGGVTRFSGSTFTHYNRNNTGIGNRINAILEDSKGYLWIAVYPGVLRVRGDSVLCISPKEGLINGSVQSLAEDDLGNIWIGTSDGLSAFTGDHFVHFTQENGLCHSSIKTITIAPDGDIWITTPNGITRMIFRPSSGIFEPRDSSYSFPKLISYGLSEGLKGTSFFHNTVIDHQNRIWAGTGTNLTMLDLVRFDHADNPPILRLISIDLNGEPVDFREPGDDWKHGLKFKAIEKYYNVPKNLVLAHSKNHMTFHFSAIDWSAPGKIMYSYKVDGVDQKWSTPGKQTSVDYRNLPTGKHTFMLRAIGESQQWSDVVSYTFTIRPPWYYSRAVIFLYFLLTFLLILAIIRWRTAHLKSRQRKLEAIILEATQEIRDQKEKVESQRDEIEAQRDTLKEQRDMLMGQKKEITDSINYAERIQHAILPEDVFMNEILPHHFVIYRPRDIVSGDFYWGKLIGNFLILVVADCTGHGVPGAIMSMLGISLLNEQVNKSRLDKPGEVLDRLREKVKVTLSQEGKKDEQKDGMDLSMIILDRESLSLQFSGAYHNLLIVRPKSAHMGEVDPSHISISNKDYQLIEIKGDRQPIAIFEREKEFATHEIQLLEGDALYLHTDGFTDQFGGPGNKKFMTRKLKRTFLQIQEKSMTEQKEQLEHILREWMGKQEQMDDILLMGVKVSRLNSK